MSVVTIRINNTDKKLLENIAKSYNKTMSDIIRESIKETIEDEIHLKLYQEGIKELEKDPTVYTHEEVLKELGINGNNDL